MDKTFLDMLRKVILDETIYLRHYIGQVKSVDDSLPQAKGRVCVAVYDLGVFTEAKGFWCWPRDKNALVTPSVNDWVEVYFINGDKDRPVYMGVAAEMKDMIPKNYTGKNTQVIFESNENECAVVFDENTKEMSVGKTDMQYAARKEDTIVINATTDSAFIVWLTGMSGLTSVTGKISTGSDQIKIGKK